MSAPKNTGPAPLGGERGPGQSAAKCIARREAIKVSAIVTSTYVQPRESLDEGAIAEYAAALKAGDTFPPIDVFHDVGPEYQLAHGHHRVEAAKRSGLQEIEAEVYQGRLVDAVVHAAGTNSDQQGVRRTAADKRKAVENLFVHARYHEESDRKIAEIVKVSPTFVGRIRKELEASGQLSTGTVEEPRPEEEGRKAPPETRRGRDGKRRKVPARGKQLRAPVLNETDAADLLLDTYGRPVAAGVLRRWVDRIQEGKPVHLDRASVLQAGKREQDRIDKRKAQEDQKPEPAEGSESKTKEESLAELQSVAQSIAAQAEELEARIKDLVSRTYKHYGRFGNGNIFKDLPGCARFFAVTERIRRGLSLALGDWEAETDPSSMGVAGGGT